MTKPTDGSGEAEPPDMEALAKRYMDLWSKQMSAMATDPTLADAMSKTMAFMTDAAKSAGMPPGRASGAGPGGGSERDEAGQGGATPPGPASAATGADVDGMAQRIDALERRIAILEAALGGLLAQAGKSGGDPA